MPAKRFINDGVHYTYDSIRVYGSLPAEIYVVGEYRNLKDPHVQDLRIADSSGKILVDITGNHWREIAGSALEPTDIGATPSSNGDGEERAESFRIVVSDPGDLDSIKAVALSPEKPEEQEIQIEVAAAALNFRDALSALGQLKDIENGPQPIGGECSGIVRAVGDRVVNVEPGDHVVATARGSFASHVNVDCSCVAAIPDNLSFEEAAGIPIVFLTADYAINKIAKLKKRERILIHAASGGVGLAAIQMARMAGAEIFATAGHPDKRAYLSEIGIEHIMDSRSLDFVEEIRDKTDGEGIDVVLNSLAGEFIPASLGLLRLNGRFLEIGKRDINADTPLGLYPFHKNLTFSAIDLGLLIEARDPLIRRMLERRMAQFARGELKVPPTSVIPIDEIANGFRRMARTEHIGKIVFQVRSDLDPARELTRRFQESYGKGVSVRGGLEIFRRIISSDATPPNLLITGFSIKGAGESRVSTVSSARRERPDLNTPYRAPSSKAEKEFAEIWESTLGFPGIGVDDDFFDLGGDSITAIQTQYAINRNFEINLTNTDFIMFPTIAGLVERTGLASVVSRK